jgi:hypothetical protein
LTDPGRYERLSGSAVENQRRLPPERIAAEFAVELVRFFNRGNSGPGGG